MKNYLFRLDADAETKYTPHYYQENAHQIALNAVEQSIARTFISSPTGTGKSIMMLRAHNATFHDSYIITPSDEIIVPMLDKLGYKINTQRELVELSDRLRITTPIRFRNRMIAGKIPTPPRIVYLDEAQSTTADTYSEIDSMLDADAIHVGYSGTYYRGTPKGTAELVAMWGNPHIVLTERDAVEKGYTSMPMCETVPLLDDDIVKVSNGEFSIESLTKETGNVLDAAFKNMIDRGWFHKVAGKLIPMRPTMVTIPTSNVYGILQSVCEKYGIEHSFINQATTPKDRRQILQRVSLSQTTLVQINVISEGVDISIRNHFDLAPTLSPRRWRQRFGRGTRPLQGNEQPGQYICANRNLERHGYLLEGLLPVAALVTAQTAFEKPTDRIKHRAFGIETLGKFKGFYIKTVSGLQCTCYSITQMVGHRRVNYFVIAHPAYGRVLWFTRDDVQQLLDDNSKHMKWGKWQLCDQPAELTGFRSGQTAPLTESQRLVWEKYSKKHGLQTDQPIDKHKVQTLFVLMDSKAGLA